MGLDKDLVVADRLMDADVGEKKNMVESSSGAAVDGGCVCDTGVKGAVLSSPTVRSDS